MKAPLIGLLHQHRNCILFRRLRRLGRRQSTSILWRFSIQAWAMNTNLASLPFPLRSSRASGSVVL